VGHRVDKDADVQPGATLRVYADLLPASDGTAPFSIHTFNQITGGDTIYPRQIAVANDHFVFTRKEADDKQTAIGKAFAQKFGIAKPYYATPGDGIFHFYFPEQGLVHPGSFVAGADSHSRAYGAYGAVGIGVGIDDPRVRLGHRLRVHDAVEGATRRLHRHAAAMGEREGHRAQAPRALGHRAVAGDVRRVRRREDAAADRVPQHDREHDGRGRGPERDLRRRTSITAAWYREKGIALPYPLVRGGKDAHYEIDETLDLSDVVPMIAKPYSPGNAFAADEVAIGAPDLRQGVHRLVHERQLRRSPPGRARGPRRARRGPHEGRHGLRRVPGLGLGEGRDRAARSAARRRVRRHVLRSVGAQIRMSWCGPCFGQGDDALEQGQRAITSFNRNWQNRMGVGGEGYLASPAVVASSALLGYMAPPSALHLRWKPERYGI